MKFEKRFVRVVLIALIALVAVSVARPRLEAAENKTAALLDDPVVARGRGFEIKQSQVDDMFATFRARRAAEGEVILPNERAKVETDILEKLIATQLCLGQATAEDRAKGAEIAKAVVADQIKAARSEESFHRELRAVGMTPEQFRAQIGEQAIVKAVLDREIRARKTITEAEAKKFYDGNQKLFEQPEMARVTAILISTLDGDSTRPLPAEQRVQKRELAERILVRAKAGEDFIKLVKEFSDDQNSRPRNGEYTIARNDRRFVLTPEFEGAAFSLQSGQVSDLVTSRYGFHILRGEEKIPAKIAEFEKVQERIKEGLIQEYVQQELPGYIDKLKQAGGVEILAGSGKK